METIRFDLPQSEIPTSWYNIQADLPEPLPPVIHPGRMDPIGPDDLAPLFAMELIKQEVSQEREIPIPGTDPRDLRPVASDPAVPGAAPGAGARYAGAALLQVRGRLARGLAQAQHRGRAGLLQPRGGGDAAHHRDRRGTVGQRAGHGRRLPGRRLRGVHGAGLLRRQAVPALDDGGVRRQRHRQSVERDQRRPAGAGVTARFARLPRHRHLGGGGGRGHQRRQQEVLPGLGPQPRAHAPDRDRPRGAGAIRARRRLPGRHGGLHGRRLLVRGIHLPVRTGQAPRAARHALRGGRAHGRAQPDRRPVPLRLRGRRGHYAAHQDVHPRPLVRAGAHSRRRATLPRHGAADLPPVRPGA